MYDSFLERFIDSTVNILKDGGCNSPETLEQVFTSWHHMIEYLQKYLIKNIVGFINVIAPIRFFENYNVQDLMADAVSLLLGTLSKIGPSTELKKRYTIQDLGKSGNHYIPQDLGGEDPLHCNMHIVDLISC